MAIDSADFDLVKELRDLQRLTVEALRLQSLANEKMLKQQQQLLAVFNEVATEIHLMRGEITPTLDKPRLPMPARKAG